MPVEKDVTEYSEKTWPRKEQHIMSPAQMREHYNTTMRAKCRETKDEKWKKKLTQKELVSVISSLYSEIEDFIVERTSPITLPVIGTFYVEKRKRGMAPATSKKGKVKELLGLRKQYTWKLKWNRKSSTVENAKFYKFKLRKTPYGDDSGLGRIQAK
jgi:nucleoid DNA-binding protein